MGKLFIHLFNFLISETTGRAVSACLKLIWRALSCCTDSLRGDSWWGQCQVSKPLALPLLIQLEQLQVNLLYVLTPLIR